MQTELDPKTLYVVATPIGNLSDLSPRAQFILGHVNLIAAEDTRHTRQLLQHFNIQTRTIALHAHNENAQAQGLIEKLLHGESLALVSDAGTPLISDPGAGLVTLAHEQGIAVRAIPGPCAAIAALSVAGLPCERFCFEGFLPAKVGARQKKLQSLTAETRTLIFYEAPHRIQETLVDMAHIFGEHRPATLAKEITKSFETIQKGILSTLLTWINAADVHRKGEFVIVVAGVPSDVLMKLSDTQETHFKSLLTHFPLRQAVLMMTDLTGLPKNELYARALELDREAKSSYAQDS